MLLSFLQLFALTWMAPSCNPNGATQDNGTASNPDTAPSPQNETTPLDNRPFTASAISSAIEVLNPSDPTRPMYHSVGTLPFGEKFVRTVRLRNLEKSPITVRRINPACSCSRVSRISTTGPEGETVLGQLGQRGNILTIAPGAEFEIDILVDTALTTPNASKLAILRVITDSEVQPFLTFEVHFFPERLFDLAAPRIAMGQIPLGGGVGETLQIYSRASLNQARLLEVIETSPGLEAELALIEGYQSNWNLTVTAVGQTKKGFWRGHILLSTTDRNGEGNEGRLKVPVQGQVVDAIMVYPEHLTFGAVTEDLNRSMKAVVKGLTPGHTLKVTEVRFEGASAQYVSSSLEPVGVNSFGRAVQVEVLLELAANAPSGPLDLEMIVHLEGESPGHLRRKIQGEIR